MGHVSLNLFHKNNRAFFKPFDEKTDINSKTGKSGIAVYTSSCSLFYILACLFKRVIKYTDCLGEVHRINKNSLVTWFSRHGVTLQGFSEKEINAKALQILLKERLSELDFRFLQLDLSKDQVKTLDYDKLTIRQFNDIINIERVPLLPEKALAKFLSFFRAEEYNHLTEEQVKKIDAKVLAKAFKRVNPDLLFDVNLLDTNQILECFDYLILKRFSEDKCKEFVSKLTSDQIKTNYPRFNYFIFKNLTKEQSADLLLNLSIIDSKNVEVLAWVLDLIEKLTPNEIELYFTTTYFDDEQVLLEFLDCVSDEQLIAINLDKVKPLQRGAIEREVSKREQTQQMEEFLAKINNTGTLTSFLKGLTSEQLSWIRLENVTKAQKIAIKTEIAHRKTN